MPDNAAGGQRITMAGQAKPHGGYTLVEVMLALAVTVWILGVITSFTYNGFLSGRFSDTGTEAQDNARVGLDRVVREIRRAKTVSIGGPLAEQVTGVKTDGETFTFYRSGEQLLYRIRKPGGETGTVPVATGITSVRFTEPAPGLVQIELVSRRGDWTVPLSTCVRARNEL